MDIYHSPMLGLEFNAYPFQQNKQTSHYITIIENAIQNPPLIGEKHHIVPKSLGGSNDLANLVLLAIIDHVRAHRLLVNMTVGLDRQRMALAWKRILGSHSSLATNHEIAMARDLARTAISNIWQSKSSEDKARISALHSDITCDIWAARTKEEKEEIYTKISATSIATWAAKSDKEMEDFRIKNSAAQLSKTKNEQLAINDRRFATMKTKSITEKAEIAVKKRTACARTWANKSPQEIAKYVAKSQAGWISKTAEEKEKVYEKRRVTRAINKAKKNSS